MPDKSKVILTVGCRNLPADGSLAFGINMDVGFEGFAHHKDTLKTELSRDSNPNFTNQLLVDYIFEEKQIIVVTVIYVAGNQEFVFGQSCLSLARVVHEGGQSESPIEIQDDRLINMQKMKPYFVVNLKEDTQQKESFQLKMKGTDLDKKDLFGKSDPYLLLYKRSDRGKWIRTYRTEVIKNNLYPEWKPLSICPNKLCDDDFNNDILVKCFDWDGADGDPEDMDSEFDEIIGECCFTCQQLLDSHNNSLTLELINYKKQKKKRGYLHSGKLLICADLTAKSYTFLDYMLSGIDLNFIVAVDLSVPKVNLEDQIESIRLYNVTRQSNEYEVAIKAVLEILKEYDSDNQFPAFGFGAQIPPDMKECHEYPLNGDFNNPFCRGVDGVLKAYQNTLKSIKPLNTAAFSPVIRQVNSLAKSHIDGKHYFILLILTNGTAEDWVETKRAVIEASLLPVSIIVVGIGSGSFNDMKILDQDQGLLRVGNDKAIRDNVQFVPMRKFLRMAADGSRNLKWNKVSLAKEVLAELPQQLVTHMTLNGVKPQPSSLKSSPSQSAGNERRAEITSNNAAIATPLTPQHCKPNAREVQQQKLRRCVTAHVNIRPDNSSGSASNSLTSGGLASSGSYRRKQATENFFSHISNASPSHSSSRSSLRKNSFEQKSPDRRLANHRRH